MGKKIYTLRAQQRHRDYKRNNLGERSMVRYLYERNSHRLWEKGESDKAKEIPLTQKECQALRVNFFLKKNPIPTQKI